MMVCIYFSGDEVDGFLKVGLDQMVEEQDGLGEAIQLRRNLEVLELYPMDTNARVHSPE